MNFAFSHVRKRFFIYIKPSIKNFNFEFLISIIPMKILTSFLFILILFTNNAFPQTTIKADSLYNLFLQSDKNTRVDKIGDLLKVLNDLDTNYVKATIAKLLQQISVYSDKKSYIYALLYDDQFGTYEKKMKECREAYKLAQKLNDHNLLGVVEENIGVRFKEYEQYDSSMTYTLRAKKLFEEVNNKNQLVSVIHTIGDLHFYAELYDEAEDFYKRVLQLKGDPIAWHDWRNVVITNDFGEIEMHRNNYGKAISYFNNSIGYVFERGKNLTKYDRTQLSYTYYLLSQACLLKKDYTQANIYCQKSLAIAIANQIYDYQILLYITEADLLYNKSQNHASLVYLKKAEKLLEEHPSIEAQIYLYEVESKTYLALADYKNASHYQAKLIVAKDMNNNRLSETKFMNIYAKNNYNRLNRELDTIQRENAFLIVFISVVSLFFVVVSFMFFKIRRSNLRLVGKSLELIKAEKHEKLQHMPADLAIMSVSELSEETILEHEDSSLSENLRDEIMREEEQSEHGSRTLSKEQLQTLANSLNSLVIEQKLFLNQDISLQQLSALLRTNRSYLSRAINVEYECNFHTYINNLRIKEAISLISEGDHKLLTLEAIAGQVGFNNRTSFALAFKKYTGVSPSFFIKNLSAVKME